MPWGVWKYSDSANGTVKDEDGQPLEFETPEKAEEYAEMRRDSARRREAMETYAVRQIPRRSWRPRNMPNAVVVASILATILGGDLVIDREISKGNASGVMIAQSESALAQTLDKFQSTKQAAKEAAAEAAREVAQELRTEPPPDGCTCRLPDGRELTCRYGGPHCDVDARKTCEAALGCVKAGGCCR